MQRIVLGFCMGRTDHVDQHTVYVLGSTSREEITRGPCSTGIIGKRSSSCTPASADWTGPCSESPGNLSWRHRCPWHQTTWPLQRLQPTALYPQSQPEGPPYWPLHLHWPPKQRAPLLQLRLSCGTGQVSRKGDHDIYMPVAHAARTSKSVVRRLPYHGMGIYMCQISDKFSCSPQHVVGPRLTDPAL